MKHLLLVIVMVSMDVGCNQMETVPNRPAIESSITDPNPSETFPSLDWLSIDTTGWKISIDEKKMKVWQDDDDDGDTLALVLYSAPEITGNGLPESYPDLVKGSGPLIQHCRTIALEHQRGIVEAKVVPLMDGLFCSKDITKRRLPDSPGLEFDGLVLIPRRDFSYWILLNCKETGTTGIREAFVLKTEMESGNVLFDVAHDKKSGNVNGFKRDPYDPDFDEGALFNLADQEKYDELFPESPLTRLRTKLNRVMESIKLAPEIINADPWAGPELHR